MAAGQQQTGAVCRGHTASCTLWHLQFCLTPHWLRATVSPSHSIPLSTTLYSLMHEAAARGSDERLTSKPQHKAGGGHLKMYLDFLFKSSNESTESKG
ncbi:hypothetical protein ATANTOWER_000614 [Ataeniobius toweri]|uniref:Uncharacterized protein n=1 Tax=Ataeniobius toweri TaxID=208326 RepID=A0ABU7A3L7_9TELE|nr:hypothetical protein [Ataeniobius toweri]